MNHPYLKHYRFVIKTLAPVFIGSGDQISSKEYIYDNDSVSFLSMPELYGVLIKHHLFEKYKRFDGTLYRFLKNNIKNERTYESLKTYSIQVDREVFKSDTSRPNLSAIQTFIKDPYGCPYIPGSSLKGVLRTILENAWYLNHPDSAEKMAEQVNDHLYFEGKDKKKYLKNENMAMSEAVFHRSLFPDEHHQFTEEKIKKLVNDSMRGLIVSDSAPLRLSDLCICRKIDIDTNGKKKSVPVLRECLKPEIEVAFDITLDTTMFPLTVHEIILAMRAFYTHYQNAFMNHFKKAPPTQGNSTTFFLGGGTGYASKTATYAIFKDKVAAEIAGEILHNTTPHEHYDDADIGGVSPRILKCTKYGTKDKSRLYQMGACYLVSFK